VPAVPGADGSGGPSLPAVELMALLSSQAGLDVPDAVPDDVARAVLAEGEVDVIGRMPWSSNATFLAKVERDGDAVLAIYKPQAGERPLWDFPEGTLCCREVAAYELSELLGWSLVPHTVLRDDMPLGVGALQRFVDHDPEEHYFELQAGRDDVFQRFAAFDVLANNTDRKGGHVLLGGDGGVWGIDHGVCFHPQWKLRTVIWEFAGDALPAPLLDSISCAAEHLDDVLDSLLSPVEVDAVRKRAQRLLQTRRYPPQTGDYHDYPWPMV
jgi:uncharacterized repeat protein (TIGR03843 family)